MRSTEYFGGGSSTALRLTARHLRRLSSASDVDASLFFDTSILGERAADLLRSDTDTDDGAPGEPEIIDPIDPDISLSGLRQRRQTAGGVASFRHRPTASQNILVTLNATRSSYPKLPDRSNFWSYSAAAQFSSRLSAQETVGARGSVQRVRYDSGAGTYDTFRPELNYSRVLGDRWNLQGALHAGFSRGAGPLRSTGGTDLGGSATICRATPPRERYCFNVVRELVASGFGAARQRTGADASYSYRPDEYSEARLGASLERFSGGVAPGSGEAVSLSRVVSWSAEAGYSRKLSQRLAANGLIGYRGISRATSARAQDFSATLSVSYNFGSQE
jgi:hypothetical protein